MATLEIRGLVRKFDYFRALDSIDLDLSRGELLTVFGPNGAGKTTLIRLLSTQLRPSEGTITVDGHDLVQHRRDVRRHIGLISHDTFLYPTLTAAENLSFYGRLYDVKNLKDRVDEMLQLVELADRRSSQVSTFSRGMEQRLCIARALLHEPQIVLLDEPYTGLDQHAARMLTETLKKLVSRNRAVLMVTHNLGRGLDIASRVAVLVKGNIVFDKSADEVESADFEQRYFEYVEGGAS